MPALIFAKLFIKEKFEALSWLRTRATVKKKTFMTLFANAMQQHPFCKQGHNNMRPFQGRTAV